jgi:hypothetical protein
MEIKAVLEEGAAAHNWNVSLLKVREAQNQLEELMMLLNSTAPAVKARESISFAHPAAAAAGRAEPC